MIVLLLAAGFGTRLYPLTKNVPKALLQIGKKPMIEHIFDRLEELPDIEKAVVVSNHVFLPQFQQWTQRFQPRTRIPIVVVDDGSTSDSNRRGGVGTIAFGIEAGKVNGSLLVLASDNLFNFSLQKAKRLFEDKKADVIGCFDVKSKEEAKKMASVALDADRKIVRFIEKPADPFSTLISCCIYFLTPQTVPLVQQYLKAGNSPDKTGEFIQWLYKQKPVYGFAYDRPQDQWFDIGTLEVLEKVRKNPAFA